MVSSAAPRTTDMEPIWRQGLESAPQGTTYSGTPVARAGDVSNIAQIAPFAVRYIQGVEDSQGVDSVSAASSLPAGCAGKEVLS